MLIVCPQCESRYHIDGVDVRAEGRTVRCARCRAEWQVFPEPAAEAPATASAPSLDDGETLVAPPLLHGVPDFAAPPERPAVHDIEAVAMRPGKGLRRPAARKRRMPRLLPSWRTTALVAGLAAVALLVAGRAAVVRQAPAAASFYALMRLPVNVRGIAFEDVATHAESEGDAPVLVVEGRLRNVAGGAVPVTPLRFAIRDGAGVDVYSWTAAPARAVLESGAGMPFKSRLALPPAEGRTVAVRFARADDNAAAGR